VVEHPLFVQVDQGRGRQRHPRCRSADLAGLEYGRRRPTAHRPFQATPSAPPRPMHRDTAATQNGYSSRYCDMRAIWGSSSRPVAEQLQCAAGSPRGPACSRRSANICPSSGRVAPRRTPPAEAASQIRAEPVVVPARIIDVEEKYDRQHGCVCSSLGSCHTSSAGDDVGGDIGAPRAGSYSTPGGITEHRVDHLPRGSTVRPG